MPLTVRENNAVSSGCYPQAGSVIGVDASAPALDNRVVNCYFGRCHPPKDIARLFSIMMTEHDKPSSAARGMVISPCSKMNYSWC
jgi:hypothetical protein